MNYFQVLQDYGDGIKILRDWLGADGVPVSQEVAQARANICVDCKRNESGFQLTDAISQAIKEQIELKNHLELKVAGEKSLETCNACSCPIRLQIWCPDKLFQNHYTKADAVRYSVFCWKRKLMEAQNG